MNINPTYMSYIISRDETHIEYTEMVRNKSIEKVFTMKGRYTGEMTVYEITKFLEEKLKGEIK